MALLRAQEIVANRCLDRFVRRIPWSTVSNAFLKSRNTLILILRLSTLENLESVILKAFSR